MTIGTIQNIVLCIMLGSCSVFDIRKKHIPVIVVVVCGVIAVACSYIAGGYAAFDTLLGIGIGLLLFVISKVTREAIGMGDVIVFFVLGAVMGGSQAIIVLLYSSFFAAVYSMILLVVKKMNRKETIPFLPFILLGYLGVMML